MKRNDQQGFALVTTTIILSILLTLAFVVVSTTLSGRKASQTLEGTFYAVQAADAGIQKAKFCLNGGAAGKCGGTSGASYPGETDVAVGTGTFTTTLTGSGSTRTITSVGKAATGLTRTVKEDLTTIPPTDSTGFSYALQAGTGGGHMENNSSISGTIYANGDIDCQSTNAVITGDAYSSKVGGKIQSCKVNFNAHADKVLSSKVLGSVYFVNDPADIAGTTLFVAKYSGQATPTAAPMPAVDLDFWRDSAEAGGVINGNYSPTNGANVGPIRINGDFTMNNNVNITVKGPIWVKGNITTGNNSSFTLDSAFGGYSTAILADDQANPATKGKIDITNNTTISGSGSSTSHIMFLSTNTSTNDALPAIKVANNAAGAVFYAMNGTLRLSNNAGAKSLAGYRLFLDQNSSVSYIASEFTGAFSNSPAGVWHSVDQSRREIP